MTDAIAASEAGSARSSWQQVGSSASWTLRDPLSVSWPISGVAATSMQHTPYARAGSYVPTVTAPWLTGDIDW
eukprot:3437572-Amphidinium_carterae.2